MKRTMMAIIALATVATLFTSCEKDETPQNTIITKTDSLFVNFSATKTFTFFNFKNGTVVANSDSATTKWDFGLRFTTFILNSTAYGPGNTGVILQNTLYNNVTEAPSTGYAYDTTTTKKAIKDGSWYNYNPTTRTFNPKAGQTFVFKTTENNYVKMELVAVDYAPFTGPQPDKLIYRFRYTYQANGSTKF
jgi:hypothetical protein